MDETASSVIKAKVLLEVAASPSDEVFDIHSTNADLSENDIRVKDVVVTNPEKNISLARYEDMVIPGGKVIALKGPNGCGKSRFSKMFESLLPTHAR